MMSSAGDLALYRRLKAARRFFLRHGNKHGRVSIGDIAAFVKRREPELDARRRTRWRAARATSPLEHGPRFAFDRDAHDVTRETGEAWYGFAGESLPRRRPGCNMRESEMTNRQQREEEIEREFWKQLSESGESGWARAAKRRREEAGSPEGAFSLRVGTRRRS
jgi:hypothetical protein